MHNLCDYHKRNKRELVLLTAFPENEMKHNNFDYQAAYPKYMQISKHFARETKLVLIEKSLGDV